MRRPGFLAKIVVTLAGLVFSCKSDVEPSIVGRWLLDSYKVSGCASEVVNTPETSVPCCTYYNFSASGWSGDFPAYDFLGSHYPPYSISGTYSLQGNQLRIVYSDGSNVINRRVILSQTTLLLVDDTSYAGSVLGSLADGCESIITCTRQ